MSDSEAILPTPSFEIREANQIEIARGEALLTILKSYPPAIAVNMLVFTSTQLIMAMQADDPDKPIDRLVVWDRIASAVKHSIKTIEGHNAAKADPP